MVRFRFARLGLVATFLLWTGLANAQTSAVLIYDTSEPAISFAADDLRAALERKGLSVGKAPLSQIAAQTAPMQVVVTTNSAALPGQPLVSGLSKEGYAIRRGAAGSSKRLWVIGNDSVGAMYAGLELAESLKVDPNLNNVAEKLVNPALATRGIKFNIPLDARSPSYADDSTSAQANIAEMWSMPYWKGFLDEMARGRYNTLSLWNLHPFPSLVKVPEYPKAALSDVKRKAGGLWNGGGTGLDMYDPKWQLDTVKKMTIDEKIAFWREVMQYAKDRGVDVSIFTWNLFVYGTENSGYGLTTSTSNATTKDYIRKSVRSLFNTYPLLAGIGVTAGENLNGLNNTQKEQWLWDSYGRGFADAVADNPNRKIKFIHRAHQATVSDITSVFNKLPGYADADPSLRFTFKYSQAHMYSTTKPLFIQQGNWLGTIPSDKRVTLEVRNDDMYYMRWGNPDFAREYLNSIPRGKVDGILIGPDGLTWGREVVSKNPDSPRQQTIDKMWYSFRIWGQLAYDPTLPNGTFQDLLAARYPEVPSGSLYTGLSSVSKILPLVTRFYWGSLDFMWYPEASMSANGYEGVQNFITPKYSPMDSKEDGQAQLLISVKEYVDGAAPNGRLNPDAAAALLEQYATSGIQSVERLNPGGNKDLSETLGDVKAMAWLGRYYAEKMRGAVDLYRYQKTNQAADLDQARAHLRNASNHWREYAAQWSSQYLPQQLGRLNKVVDMVALQASVDKDIPAGGSPSPTNAYDITSLVLVNASNGAAIRTLLPNDTINLTTLGVPSISIQALAASGTESVKFEGAGVTRVESNPPYAFLGNSGTIYTPWAPAAGTYSITASGYSANNASGTAGKPLTVKLTIVR
jgi:hypothetical protein